MAELKTLARPYARAAYQYALSHEAVEEWSLALAKLSAAVDDGRVLRSGLPREDQAKLLIKACRELPAGMENFVSQVAANSRLNLLGACAEIFEQLKAQDQQMLSLRLSVPAALDEEQRAAARSEFSDQLGREVQVAEFESPELIGGAVARLGDLTIDHSVEGRIRRLERLLAG